MASLTSGDDLRKRLEELNGRAQQACHEKRDSKAASTPPRAA